MRAKPNPEKPTCVSIIVCDDVYRDEATKKLVIVGTFNFLHTPGFPCRHPGMTVLFTVTNAVGKYDLSLCVEHEQTGQKVMEISGPFEVGNPLAISDINMRLENLVFNEEGKYWVVLSADGEIIGQRPFVVIRTTEAPKDGGKNDE